MLTVYDIVTEVVRRKSYSNCTTTIHSILMAHYFCKYLTSNCYDKFELQEY